MKIGILAIQGSVAEHKKALQKLDIEVVEVRLPADLCSIQGIILPGGESTAQSKLMERFGVFDVLKQKIESGLPVWGTCAGAILLAKEIKGKTIPKALSVMNIEADRNAYGSQIDSFEVVLETDLDEFKNLSGVFIRAPKLQPIDSTVEVLCEYKNYPVMLQQGHMLITSFHPELTNDLRVHEYFKKICQNL